ncbi:MAG TPA: dihydrofolate reductase [Kofleriaceae bacterium]
MFDIVVAADREWGIGKANALPWPKLSGDLAHFRRVTSDAPAGSRNAVIMGRRTWESAEVRGKPLPKRLNVIVSRRGTIVPDGVLAAASLDAALAAAAQPDVATIFVIGGGELFREAFVHPQLRFTYLTRVDGAFGCDAHIPDLDALGFAPDAWPAVAGEDGGVRYRIERLTPRRGT